MHGDQGIRLKIFSKSGQFSDLGEPVTDNEDLQHLILIPKNPMNGKWGKCLRVVFYSLVLVSIASVFLIISKHHSSSRIAEVETERA